MDTQAPGLVERHALHDGRKSGIALTAAGGALERERFSARLAAVRGDAHE